MILQSLCKYYDILADEGKVPQKGYSKARISYALVISKEGELKNIVYLKKTDEKGKKFFPQLLAVPFQEKRSSGVFPYFLSDNSKYVLGLSKDKKNPIEISPKHFEAFKNYNLEILQNLENDEARAVINFLSNWNVENAQETLSNTSGYDEDIFDNASFIFTLDGTTSYIHQNPEIKEKWLQVSQDSLVGEKGQCLITGEETTLAVLHGNLKGVRDAQPAGAAIVSFNIPAFISYDKKQSYNAPVGVESAFKYVTVLNYMLEADSRQKIQIGDATTVFWAECPKADESISLFNAMINPPAKSDEKKSDEEKERDKKAEDTLQNTLLAIKQGDKVSEMEDKNFYILGLSPNNARVAIRFFYRDTLGGFARKISQHYEDLELEGGRRPYLPPWLILNETTNKNSTKDKPAPLLAGRFMKSILTGIMYPDDLYLAMIRRIRAEQDISHARVSAIKAYLTRKSRKYEKTELKEVIKVSLNEETTNTAYRLGRLFALLEKVQEMAQPGINATIKDRYFSTASATPRTVFPILIRLSQHHFGKLTSKWLEIEVGKVLDDITEFPSHLNIEDQGLFILGYYQQRQSFFKKKEEAPQELAEVQA